MKESALGQDSIGKSPRTLLQWLVVLTLCNLLYWTGLSAFGLLGPDEPTYARIATEMLAAHDWITPTLDGSVWIDKPPLFEWCDMVSISVVDDVTTAARLPSALFATALIAGVLISLRSRGKSALFSSIIIATTIGWIGFGRGATTDMALSATFGLAMLAWNKFREILNECDASGGTQVDLDGARNWKIRKRVALALFYFFIGLATLAKGPVAPGLCGLILLSFVITTRNWPLLCATLWLPGILLYLLTSLPWFIVMQIIHPEFFRSFFIDNNLRRFATNAYQHSQPFWFYLPVFIAAIVPWTFFAFRAIWNEIANLRGTGFRKRTGADNSRIDSFGLLLLLWLCIPILFFSLSQSKLPGYILPALPAAAILAGEYLGSIKNGVRGGFVLAGHCFLSALLLAAIFVVPESLSGLGTASRTIGIAFSVLGGLAMYVFTRGASATRLVLLTSFPVAFVICAILIIAAPSLDRTQSSRQLAETVRSFIKTPTRVAEYRLSREQRKGLDFYLEQPILSYTDSLLPKRFLLAAKVAPNDPVLGGLARTHSVQRLAYDSSQHVTVCLVADSADYEN